MTMRSLLRFFGIDPDRYTDGEVGSAAAFRPAEPRRDLHRSLDGRAEAAMRFKMALEKGYGLPVGAPVMVNFVEQIGEVVAFDPETGEVTIEAPAKYLGRQITVGASIAAPGERYRVVEG